MSILSDFISAAAPIAQAVIGTETLSINGGAAIAGTFNEARNSRDYEEGGFERDGMMDFVVLTATFTASYAEAATAYLGKKATARGETWRISSISKGASFVTIGLVSTNKSS
jgi:hypothetical protein